MSRPFFSFFIRMEASARRARSAKSGKGAVLCSFLSALLALRTRLAFALGRLNNANMLRLFCRQD